MAKEVTEAIMLNVSNLPENTEVVAITQDDINPRDVSVTEDILQQALEEATQNFNQENIQYVEGPETLTLGENGTISVNELQQAIQAGNGETIVLPGGYSVNDAVSSFQQIQAVDTQSLGNQIISTQGDTVIMSQLNMNSQQSINQDTGFVVQQQNDNQQIKLVVTETGQLGAIRMQESVPVLSQTIQQPQLVVLPTSVNNSSVDADIVTKVEEVPVLHPKNSPIQSRPKPIRIIVSNKKNSVTKPPLGSSDNPIRIIQKGNQYTSLQHLDEQQLGEIMQVVQQQHGLHMAAKDSYKKSNTIYNPKTQTKVVYRVIHPSDLHKSDASHNTNVTHTETTKGLLRPPPRKYWKRKRDEEEERIEGPELTSEEKKERKRAKTRTRSGRVSRPPRHMIKDYNHIHVLDWDEDYDDDDGGYKGFENKDDSRYILPCGYTGRPKKFKCEKCSKAYIGKGGLARHYRNNPEHGNQQSLGLPSKDDIVGTEDSSQSLVAGSDQSLAEALTDGSTNQSLDNNRSFPDYPPEGRTSQLAPENNMKNDKTDLKQQKDSLRHFNLDALTNNTSMNEDVPPPATSSEPGTTSPKEGTALTSKKLETTSTQDDSVADLSNIQIPVPHRVASLPQPAIQHHTPKGSKRAEAAYFLEQNTPSKRKARLRELVKLCSDEELMEIVLPRLAKVINLWEFLLMKVEVQESAKPSFLDLYQEYESLHRQVTKLCHQFLHSPEALKIAKQGGMKVTSLMAAQSVGLAANTMFDIEQKKQVTQEPTQGLDHISQNQFSNNEQGGDGSLNSSQRMDKKEENHEGSARTMPLCHSKGNIRGGTGNSRSLLAGNVLQNQIMKNSVIETGAENFINSGTSVSNSDISQNFCLMKDISQQGETTQSLLHLKSTNNEAVTNEIKDETDDASLSYIRTKENCEISDEPADRNGAISPQLNMCDENVEISNQIHPNSILPDDSHYMKDDSLDEPESNINSQVQIFQADDGSIFVQNVGGATFQVQGSDNEPLSIEAVQELLTMEGGLKLGNT